MGKGLLFFEEDPLASFGKFDPDCRNPLGVVGRLQLTESCFSQAAPTTGVLIQQVV